MWCICHNQHVNYVLWYWYKLLQVALLALLASATTGVASLVKAYRDYWN